MSMLRGGHALMKRLLSLSKPDRHVSLSVIFRRYGSDEVPPSYDMVHHDGKNQVQPLELDELLTPEKRAELAAKYNLRPEDYVPMNDKWMTLGDYPKLPEENCLEKDPYYDWDDPALRRNWGEPIMFDMDQYNALTGVDTRPQIFTRGQMWKILLSFVVPCLFLFYLGAKYPSFLPRAPKQYPEYYPGDEKRESYNDYDFFVKRGLNAQYRERKEVTNYTFANSPWGGPLP
ncbi:NADH dehydrogenase [ubiquinone] 1 beta subcomplex subunit 8, mitochondrial-like [Clavelina lepadiformis]|uniref:NADH dehydrogenase [ubiquinone] 1 beta subcomplex subunit 8, mitochondrial-like n=1 Tax=Clavelina lepadiformis TaxID=159417 RepID=UPI0040417174